MAVLKPIRLASSDSQANLPAKIFFRSGQRDPAQAGSSGIVPSFAYRTNWRKLSIGRVA
jgi:hypothetical protein